uniref:Arginase n=1 Tax=Hydatigena taeniaeformis TaxID=6205 RepID=A0A0R3WZ44_HYDTA
LHYRLESNQLLYIGLRDIDAPELKFIKELNIPYFTMHDVRRLGIGSVMETTLRTIGRFCPNCQIHLSFDIDGIDPKYAPSTGTPVPGGLSLEEAKYICKTLGQTADSPLVEVSSDLSKVADVEIGGLQGLRIPSFSQRWPIIPSTGHLGRLKSMVVAEVNASLGSVEEAKTTLRAALEIIKSALLVD